MKKLPTLIATLTMALAGSGLAIAPSASAAGVYNGHNYWTFDELSQMTAEVEAKLASRCTDPADDMCPEIFLYELSEEDEKYEAYAAYAGAKMFITSLNPGKKTAKFLFRDYDPQMALMGDKSGHDELDALYLTRYERGYYNGLLLDMLNNGNVDPRIHIAYMADVKFHSLNWFPYNQEVDLALDDFEITPKIDNTMYFTTRYSGTGTAEIINFSDCIDSPDYFEGEECKLVVNYGDFRYLPASTIARDIAASASSTETDPVSPANPTDTTGSSGTTEPTDTTNPTDTTDPTGTNDPTNTTDPTDTNESAGTTDPAENVDPNTSDPTADSNDNIDPATANPDSSDSSSSVADSNLGTSSASNSTTVATATENSSNSITTPDTGQSTAAIDAASEFPWWGIIPAALGLATAVWFFWPKSHKKQKDNA